jgi:hypothetical protein
MTIQGRQESSNTRDPSFHGTERDFMFQFRIVGAASKP